MDPFNLGELTTAVLNAMFKGGSCETNTPVISSEGGMRIVCTGQKDTLLMLQRKEEKEKVTVVAKLQANKNPGRGDPNEPQYVVIGHDYIDSAMVFTFPALCTDPAKTQMPCTLIKDWSSSQLVVEIEKSDKKSYNKLILNSGIILREVTGFQFARIVKHDSKELDNHLVSWYEFIDGDDIESEENSDNLQPESIYMKLHLAHTSDIHDIQNQKMVMNYWKDHLTLTFAKNAGPTEASSRRQFISINHKLTRDRTAFLNQKPTTRSINSEQLFLFDAIYVKTLEENNIKYPYYEILLGYENTEGQKIIPWDEPYVQFQIGEPDLPMIPEAAEISQIELHTSNPVLIGITVSLVLIIIIVVIAFSCKKVKSDERERVQRIMSEKYEKDKLLDPKNSINPEVKFEEFLKLFEDQNMASEMQKLYIPADDIERTNIKLGKGQFGIASVAKYRNRKVCIKTCRIDMDLTIADEPSAADYKDGASAGYGSSINSTLFKINEDLFQDIFKEALQMKSFEHENVMKVIGVSLDSQLCPEILLPLMGRGDLLTYVRKEENVVTYKHVTRSFI